MLFNLSGRWNKRASALATTALSAWLFIGAAPLFAQGAVTGTVTDSESLAPVTGAQVFVAGTAVGTLSSAQGTYRLEGVPTGQQTITVRLIGYRELSQAVTVQSGQVATADFSVTQTALRLQDIVVTGVVGETPRVKLPFTVERLNAADMPVPASDASSLLAGKGAGISVMSGSGQPGQEAGITLRGPTSINASGRSQSPLIVIDGVIQSESATLADVGALDIQTVEIVKGAAAASLYGSRAQNGVIEIMTKRGNNLGNNTLDLMARGEFGMGQLEGSLSSSWHHALLMNEAGTKFIDTAGDEVDYNQFNTPGFGSQVLVNKVDPSQAGSVQTAFNDAKFPGQLKDPIEEFFDPGETYDVYAAVTGRIGESSFRVSVDQFSESGVVSCSVCIDNLETLNANRVAQGLSAFDVSAPVDEGYSRQNMRLNVDTRFGDIDIAASGFYSRSQQDDAAISNGSFSRLTFMSPAADLAEIDPTDGYPVSNADPSSIEQNPLYLLAVATEIDERTRAMGSVNLNYSPTGMEWLTVEANASFDRTDFNDIGIRPKNEETRDGDHTGGSLREGSFTDEAVNASITVGATQTFMDGDLTIRAKTRYLVEDQGYVSSGVFGNRFSVADVPNFGAIVGETVGQNLVRQIKAEGLFGIASADYQGKYIVDGLVRRDGSSLFGPEERWQTYYRGSVAWRLTQEDFWNIDWIDEFKLRFSLGTAGGRPNFFAQYETFGVSAGAIFPVSLGNEALKPEYTTEREAGFNFVFAENIGLDYTYAWALTDDQLLQVPQPAFVGFSSQWQNAGAISSKTHEISLRYSAIDERDTGLQFRLSWDKTHQMIERLDVPEYSDGPFGSIWIAAGRPLGEFWGAVGVQNCADLAPTGVSMADCEANFQINDDGYLVATGTGNEYTDGFSKSLWGTSVSVNDASGTTTYPWGILIEKFDYSPTCKAKNPSTYASDCVLTNFLPMGNVTPDFNMSWATNFRYKGLSVNSLISSSYGHTIQNGTRTWRMRSNRGGDADQGNKSREHRKPVAYQDAMYNTGQGGGWFQEDASWVKIRELSVGYTLPDSFVESMFGNVVKRLTLSAIGRNLLTLTNYTGYDPEVGENAGSFTNIASDGFTYPNFRVYTFAAEMVF